MESKKEIPFSGITKEPESPSPPVFCMSSKTVKFVSLLSEELLCFFAQLTVSKITDSIRTNLPSCFSGFMSIKTFISLTAVWRIGPIWLKKHILLSLSFSIKKIKHVKNPNALN